MLLLLLPKMMIAIVITIIISIITMSVVPRY